MLGAWSARSFCNVRSQRSRAWACHLHVWRWARRARLECRRWPSRPWDKPIPSITPSPCRKWRSPVSPHLHPDDSDQRNHRADSAAILRSLNGIAQLVSKGVSFHIAAEILWGSPRAFPVSVVAAASFLYTIVHNGYSSAVCGSSEFYAYEEVAAWVKGCVVRGLLHRNFVTSWKIDMLWNAFVTEVHPPVRKWKLSVAKMDLAINEFGQIYVNKSMEV